MTDRSSGHHLTALPYDPEAERAATQHAVEAAEASEQAPAWMATQATPDMDPVSLRARLERAHLEAVQLSGQIGDLKRELEDRDEAIKVYTAQMVLDQGRLERVRALHRPAECVNVRCKQKQWCIGCDPDGLDDCSEHPWPCPTITALDQPAAEQPDNATDQADDTHGLGVRHANTLWDAIAIGAPTVMVQYERVCEAVARIVREHTAPPTPAATQATDAAAEASRQLDADPHGLEAGMIVKAYTEHGTQKWVFRCWGTDTCDGALSLDHYSEQSAERARDRHVAEDHPTEEQQ